MKIQEPVKQETKKIAIGVVVLSLVMMLVFAALGYFDMTVLWGTALGAGFAILNFFMMAMTVQHAAEQMNGVTLPPEEDQEEKEASAGENPPAPKEELPEQKRARGIVQKSYYLRLLLTAAVVVLAIKAPVFNAIPTVIAQFFPRMTITAQPLLQKIRKGE